MVYENPRELTRSVPVCRHECCGTVGTLCRWSRRIAALALTFAFLVFLASCSRSSSGPGAGLDPLPIAGGVTEMERVEELSETVANRFIEFSDKVRRRDFDAAAVYLGEDFLGTAFGACAAQPAETLPVGVTRTRFDPAPARAEPANRATFLRSLREFLSPLESIEYVFFKTRGAEFTPDANRGVLRMTVQIIGREPGDRPFSLNGAAAAEALKVGEAWVLRRFVLKSLNVTRRDSPVFTDVATSAGVASFGPRLGTGDNTNFYWRGAATADVDGDGYYDIFTTTSRRAWLYRNRGDGTFEDATGGFGIDAPANSTGPLFFDYDRDGDPDLFLGYVGWRVDGVPQGQSLRLLRNEGGKRFVDVTDAVGLGNQYLEAFSACASDVDGDGWLDLYISAYNRLDAEYPNSWYRATNGSPNALFHNREGRFVDIAAEAGVAGTGWSYAASFADFDEDGDEDLYVANDYGDNSLYRNEGSLRFRDVAAELGVLDTGNGMGVTWGDLDNDGRLDLYVSNMSSSAGNRILSRLPRSGGPGSERSEGSSSRHSSRGVQSTLAKLAAGNTIFRQSGARFEALPAEKGGIGASWAWSAALLDIDLDGRLDIYVANGFISGDSLKDT